MGLRQAFFFIRMCAPVADRGALFIRTSYDRWSVGTFGAMRIVTPGARTARSIGGTVEVIMKVMLVATAAIPNPTTFPHVG